MAVRRAILLLFAASAFGTGAEAASQDVEQGIAIDPRGVVVACTRIVVPRQLPQLRPQPMVNRVHIDRRGLFWNEAATDPATLRLYFALTTNMNPVPYLLVEIGPGADPGLVRQARDAIHLGTGCPPSRVWNARRSDRQSVNKRG